MKKICDLHAHSNCSDGSLSPEELVCLAEKTGLSALALTDHNTTKGLAAFMAAGENSTVETVAGCEFSTEFEGKEYHIVGLFLPESSWQELEDFVFLQHMAKHHSNVQMIEKLSADGYQITYEEAKALTDADEFNRAHVARVLLQKGYVESVEQAFETLLNVESGYYVPPKRVSSAATIRFIHANAGVSIWAHPFHSTDENTVERVLPHFVKAGLDAMEVIYTTYSDHEKRRAKELADKYGLLYSGGSDFHGAAKPNIFLGRGYGELRVPYEFYSRLKERRSKKVQA